LEASAEVKAASEGARVPLLTCAALRIGHEDPILPPIDLTIRSGELWSVIGRNGSGKTTWFKTVLGLLPPLGGKVVHDRPRLRLSYIPQRSSYDDLYPVRASDVVAMGTDRGWSFLRPRFGDPPEVMAALEEVEARDLASRPFRSLSEGQKQRVLLARLVASRAEIAFLDEPTAAMDAVAERQAFELMARLRDRHGMAVVVVSHYLGLAREFADRALLVDRDSQTVVSGAPNEVLQHSVFRARYGRVSEEPRG
jgi:zinc transport system ATP-binding protein